MIAGTLPFTPGTPSTYLKVQTTERKVYLLRYDGEGDEWTLQSGFDGDELFATKAETLPALSLRMAQGRPIRRQRS